VTRINNALIIGAGIAGPTAAMALGKAGIDATIYEAHGPGAEHVGAGFNIATNGLDALAAIDALDATKGLGIPATRISMYNRKARLLGTVASGLPRPGAADTTTFKRGELFTALTNEAQRRGITIEYHRRLVRIEQSDTSVTAHFADGTRESGDVLIGADGVSSTTRTHVDPSAPPPRYTGLVSFGGFGRNPGLAPEPGLWKMMFGRRAFFGWFVPDTTQVWWFISVPMTNPLSRNEILAEGTRAWLPRLIDLFAGDDVPVEPIVRAQADELIVVGAEYDLPNMRTWVRDRVVIIGDAAHRASTSSGQGASMAIEDAVTLGRCLRDIDDPVTAFATLQHLRRPRTDKILALGAKTASSKAAGPVAAAVRDAFMQIGFRFFYKPESSAWLLRNHNDWNERVTPATA
jgi:2-polyprenyl-6-methoxyphenol hydroxylase-like FAD-dependent oxidoreductase